MAAHSDCSSIFQGFNSQGEVALELGRSQNLSWLKKKKGGGTRDSSWTVGFGCGFAVLSRKEGKKKSCLSAVATEQLGSAHGVISFFLFLFATVVVRL